MKLQEAFELFKSIRLPDNSAVSEELSYIFFELAIYDGHVAGMVDKLLAKKKVSLKELEYDNTIENKLADFLKKTNDTKDPDYFTATEMINYLKEIKNLLTIAVVESKAVN